jgi:hypothetical protein
MPMPNKQLCDCGRPIDRDPVTGKPKYRISSAVVCQRCHDLQRRYQFCDLRGPTRDELRQANPTNLGGLPYATVPHWAMKGIA